MKLQDTNINPLENIYKSFISILNNLTIKYNYKADKYETIEIRMKADEYLDALNEKDTYETYVDYTRKELKAVGCTDEKLLYELERTEDISIIPLKYHNDLLLQRRKYIVDHYEEQNNYYRELNGYPPLKDNDVIYPPKDIIDTYGLESIPLYKIQDYYNKKEKSLGDYYISIIEGTGYIDELIKKYPEKTYLKYLGSNRISLYSLRKSKNFEIIQLKQSNISKVVYDQFVQIYEECRSYFMKTIYVYNYKSFIQYYDNFIALSIMVMTIQQIVVRQQQYAVKRDFFNAYSVKALYDAYDIPYDLNIDDETQSDIIQNLNMLIQNKSTNKVIYNIANLLGFSNVNVYKYYLSKEHKLDDYGAPIILYKERFNSNTGEIETVPDYEAMYDVYFQKTELTDDDYLGSYNDLSNRKDYTEVTTDDPFWWEDDNVLKRVWETDYNFVESKYLSLGVSYSLTEVVYDNILLLKMIMENEELIDDVRIKLPRILENTEVSLFDTIILLICLVAAKHNITGEIITIPTQVTSVVDYMHNIDQVDMLVDTLSFNFDYFDPNNKENQMEISKMREILGEADFERFRTYITQASFKTNTNKDKVQILNSVFENIKNIQALLTYALTKAKDRKSYETIKRMYDAVFFSRETRKVFTITGKYTGYQRTAWTYAEFLYYRNPKLYQSMFEINHEEEYEKYLKNTKTKKSKLSFEEFMAQVEKGIIKLDYGQLSKKYINEDTNGDKDDVLYYYISHVISRLEMTITKSKFLHILNDSSTPLEELLLKLVRFFKSYTIDIIGLDTLFVCDIKTKNILHYFDEIYKANKLELLKERFHLSYSDVIHILTSHMDKDEQLKFYEKYDFTKLLLLTKPEFNHIFLTEKFTLSKLIEMNDDSLTKLFDIVKFIEANLRAKDDHVKFYEKYSYTRVFWLVDKENNHVYLTDDLLTSSSIDVSDSSLIKIDDSAHLLESVVDVNEKFKLKDGIVKSWYSE